MGRPDTSCNPGNRFHTYVAAFCLRPEKKLLMDDVDIIRMLTADLLIGAA